MARHCSILTEMQLMQYKIKHITEYCILIGVQKDGGATSVGRIIFIEQNAGLPSRHVMPVARPFKVLLSLAVGFTWVSQEAINLWHFADIQCWYHVAAGVSHGFK